MADAHYLEALEGQGALFGGLGRETTLHQNPARDREKGLC